MLHRYNTHFCALRADTPELVRKAKMIRYQVYCVERNFEKPADHAECMESDKYDGAAVHSLVVHRATSQAIGTARLILPARGLPIQRILHEQGVRAEDHFPVATAAEVSRFAISN